MGGCRTPKTLMKENYNTRFLVWAYLVSLVNDRTGTKNYPKMAFAGDGLL